LVLASVATSALAGVLPTVTVYSRQTAEIRPIKGTRIPRSRRCPGHGSLPPCGRQPLGGRALNPDITAGDIDARWQTSTLRSSSSTTDRRSAAEAPTGPRRSGTKSTSTAISAPWRSTGLRVRCSHRFRTNCAALRSVALSPRFVDVIMCAAFGALRFRQASTGKLT
jgi:hypothetical protein